MLRIGVDVGGTNTDAAILRDRQVLATVKRPTTEDITGGVIAALAAVIDAARIPAAEVSAVMIGTTHFVNALVQRRELSKVAILRLCGPATRSLPPMVDWPDDLKAVVHGYSAMLPGGLEYDGSPIVDFEPEAVRAACVEIRALGLRSVAVSSVFSPVSTAHEDAARDIVQQELPGVAISVSHEIGRIGLLERENAAILNACLRDLGKKSVAALAAALNGLGLKCPLYLTQNDGTLMPADFAERYPVFTFASGPTNSMRGAAFLSGAEEAIVIDIGGTTTDIGALSNGFPRDSSVEAEVAGVRTNFRMPDVFSFGLGGGSLVKQQPELSVGPLSVGFRLHTEALVFGGRQLTASDIAVAAGLAAFGDKTKVAHLDKDFVKRALGWMRQRIEDAIDRVKLSASDIPVILVGGGSVLIEGDLAGASEVIRPQHYQAANAVGAAIAQVSGEVDHVVPLDSHNRHSVLEAAKAEATARATKAGADPATIRIIDIEDLPLAYLPSNAARVRAKAVGELLV